MTFGYIPSGHTMTQIVSVYDIGSVPVTINSITSSIIGYTVVSGTLPQTITTGQRADFVIQFNPTVGREVVFGTPYVHLCGASNGVGDAEWLWDEC